MAPDVSRDLIEVFCIKRAVMVGEDVGTLIPDKLWGTLGHESIGGGTRRKIRVHEYEDGSLAILDGRNVLARCGRDGETLRGSVR